MGLLPVISAEDRDYRRGWLYSRLSDPAPYDRAADYRNHLECLSAWHPELTPARIRAEVEGFADGLAGLPDRTVSHSDFDGEEHELAWWQR